MLELFRGAGIIIFFRLGTLAQILLGKSNRSEGENYILPSPAHLLQTEQAKLSVQKMDNLIQFVFPNASI